MAAPLASGTVLGLDQTAPDLQDGPIGSVDREALDWWLAQDDTTLWNQLPPAELPRAHFANVHQGCPQCGTAIFTYGGFYPWRRSHLPCDYRSTCPFCNAVFPSNDLKAGDFTSGACPDDGYGYFDEEGHIFLFAATYCRDQVRAFGAAVGQFTNHLRIGETPERAAVGVAYGDTTGHRHMDLLDVQLFAFDRPFLTDLGYPQSWASIGPWEAQWATHNAAWGILPGLDSGRIAGRGRLVRHLEIDGVHILDIEAERWARDGERWYRPGVTLRRLLALIETDGEGIALVDLTRIRGGDEHWRVCRGLEGEFTTDLSGTAQAGTVAGPEIARRQNADLPHPDYAALACMDEVSILENRENWNGSWQSRREPSVHLDLHQLRISPGAQFLTARSTAFMGEPETSNYAYRTLLWKRQPEAGTDITCIDLVFEPRLTEPTLTRARAIPSDRPEAGGAELRTRVGKKIRIYWSPSDEQTTRVHYEDGTELQGGLAIAVDDAVAAQGTLSATIDGIPFAPAQAVQQGRILSLDRDARTVEVEGLTDIRSGDRITVNPHGRAHSYLVESAEELAGNRHHLRLDVTSLLGIGRVKNAKGARIDLEYSIMARTGNLERTRLERRSGEWREIARAFNPDASSTVVDLDDPFDLKEDEWVNVVDYVEGDEVLFEPVRRSS